MIKIEEAEPDYLSLRDRAWLLHPSLTDESGETPRIGQLEKVNFI